MKTHYLKTLPEHFADVKAGRKTAELRRDDRDFEVGDVLVLNEWKPERLGFAIRGLYTGATETRIISHILRGGPWLGKGYVMLSLAPTCPHGHEIGDEACEALSCSHEAMVACTRNKNGGVS